MEIRTLKIGKRVWQLVNESWSNSNGWGHKTNVIRNGFDFGETKTKYLNRTCLIKSIPFCPTSLDIRAIKGLSGLYSSPNSFNIALAWALYWFFNNKKIFIWNKQRKVDYK